MFRFIYYVKDWQKATDQIHNKKLIEAFEMNKIFTHFLDVITFIILTGRKLVNM